MVTEKKIVFGPGDVVNIVFECAGCRARQSIPAANWKAIPQYCLNCGKDWIRGPGGGATEHPDHQLARALEQLVAQLRARVSAWPFRLLFEMPTEQ